MIKVEMLLTDKRLDGLLAYGSAGAAGVDMRVCSVNGNTLNEGETYDLRPGEQAKIGTGVAVHLESLLATEEEDGSEFLLCDEDHLTYAAILLPRSGLGTKHGIVLANTVGLIDADYQGQILAVVKNTGNDAFTLRAMDRVAQMIILPVVRPFFLSVDAFSQSSVRGAGGFGSTGKH